MTKPARFTQAEVVKALKAADRAGKKTCGYKVSPDGSIIVIFGGESVVTGNSFDEIMGR